MKVLFLNFLNYEPIKHENFSGINKRSVNHIGLQSLAKCFLSFPGLVCIHRYKLKSWKVNQTGS